MVGNMEQSAATASEVGAAPKEEPSLGNVARRRSARFEGKERPYFGPKRPGRVATKGTVEKRAKPDLGEAQARLRDGGPGEDCGNASASCALPEAVKSDSLKGKETLMKERAKIDLGLMQASVSSANGCPGEGGAVAESCNYQNEGTSNDYVKVKETLRAFNSHYLHFVQEEQQRVKHVNDKFVGHHEPSKKKTISGAEEERKRGSKRPDLKAISKMLENGSVLYYEKRIGHLPGIDVGHQFYSRAEMVVVGVHSHWLNGIDYMGVSYAKQEKYKNFTFPLAICIVLSGMYEDDKDKAEDIVYTGQGGHDLLGKKLQIGDQKLERGNLALKNSYECGTSVRVVRGHESKTSYCGKVYTYDGLYKVVKYWAEKGVRGFTIFKYKLKRLEGQPRLTTNQVMFSRTHLPSSISDLRGLVCEDISGGQENIPIPVTNVVDDSPLPTGFVYLKTMQVTNNLKLPENVPGCQCKGECMNPRTCACARLNGDDFPYVQRNGGRLIEAKSVVFECGSNCGCKLSCVNRISQQGLKYHLEVFRTPQKGWGVRSWETIPSGAPICEYTGILRRTDEVDHEAENSYIFEIDCLQTMKGLDGRERRPGDVSLLINLDDKKSEAIEYCIDAGSVGNVARFINHSCQPNLFVQCILSSHHDIKMAKVMLFAADTIPPLQELTYDYGYALDSVVGPDGKALKLQCHCGAVDCRKWLY